MATDVISQSVEKYTDSIKTVTLKEVSVSGTMAEKKTPVNHTNLDKKTIEKTNLGQDLPYLMNLTPSFVASSDAGSGIGYTSMRIRGIDVTGINVMINGVPYNDSESQGTFFVNIPDIASSLGTIQIQRGIGTSGSGTGAFGASVNMQTEYMSTDPFAEIGISGGSYNTLRSNISFGTGRIKRNWALQGRLSKIVSDGYIDRGGVNLLGYFLQGGYFAENTTVKIIAFGGKEKTGIAWNGIEKEELEEMGRTYNSAGDMFIGGKRGVRYRQNTDNYDQNHIQMTASHAFSKYLKLNATLHYTKGFGYTDEYRTGRKLKEYGLKPYSIVGDDGKAEEIKKVSLIREKYLDNDFYGLTNTIEYDNKVIKLVWNINANSYKNNHYGYIRWIERYKTPVNPEDKYYDGKGEKKELGSFIKAFYQPLDGFTLFADMQYRYINYRITGTTDNRLRIEEMNLDKNFNFFNPKGGFSYDINIHNQIYGYVGVAQREPNRKSYTCVKPEDYPTSEKMIDYELGYNLKNKSHYLGINLFYMDYVNALVPSGKMSDVGEPILQNIKNSYRTGIELSYGIGILDWLRLDGAFTYSRNKIKKYEYGIQTYDKDWNESYPIHTFTNTDIAYSPNIVASNTLTFNYKGLFARIVNKFVDKQYLNNIQDEEQSIPSYNVTDLNLEYRLSAKMFENISFNLSLNNIFNTRYTSYGWSYQYIDPEGKSVVGVGIYPQATFNVLMGVTLKI